MVNVHDETAYDYADLGILEEISNEQVAKHFRTELDDDKTNTGGTSFYGEMLIDFLIENFNLYEIQRMNLEQVNKALKNNGIKEID